MKVQGANHRHKKRHHFKHSHNEGVFSIDQYAYLSQLRNWNPRVKVGFAMLMLLLSIVANNLYVSVVIMLVMIYLIVIKGRLSVHDYIAVMTIPIIFLVLGSIAIVFGFARVEVGDYAIRLANIYIYTTKENLHVVINLWGKALAAISAMYMMTLTTPSGEIISVLSSLKVPKLMIQLMYLIYRYIFIIMDAQCRMKNSAQSRLGYCDYKTACYSFGSIASNLLLVSLRKASMYYDAMESRCYDGTLAFLDEEKPINKEQCLCMISYIVIVLGVWIITY